MQAASRSPSPRRRDVNASCVEQKETAGGPGEPPAAAVGDGATRCSAGLLSMPQEVGQVVDLLQDQGLRLSEIELNLSAHIDPAALEQLLAAVDAHAELKHLHLRVNGSDTAPIPAPLREPLAACRAFVVKGGPDARRRLFDDVPRRLDAFQLDAFQREAFDDFLNARRGYEGKDPLRGDRAARLLTVALLADDGALMLALAALVFPRRIELEGFSPGGFTLPVVDRRLSALGLGYGWRVDIMGADDFKRLTAWLSSPHGGCQAITVAMGAAQSPKWGLLLAGLMKQASLLSVRLLPAEVGEIAWAVGPASARARAPVSLSIRLLPGRVDTEAMTRCMALLRPNSLSLQADGPEGVAGVLACVEHPASVSTLNVSWNRAEGAFEALDRQLPRFVHAAVTVRATEIRWRGMKARWLSVVEAGSPWFDGFTLIELTDGSRQRFPIPGPARVAYWVKGMQHFFSQPQRHLPEDLSRSLCEDKGGVLTFEDCRALSQVSKQAWDLAAQEVRRMRAAAIAAGVQDGRIDPPMLGRLLTDASGRIDSELKDAIFQCLPVVPEGWERVAQGFTNH